MARYRTPRKKSFDWKTFLGALALGLVLIAVGILLVAAPDPPPAEPADTEAARAENGDGGDDTEAPGPVTPDPRQTSAIGGTILGTGLIVMGILLPVGTLVVEKTSGKKWARRAGKKHPFKRKI